MHILGTLPVHHDAKHNENASYSTHRVHVTVINPLRRQDSNQHSQKLLNGANPRNIGC